MARDFDGSNDKLDSGGTPNIINGATACSVGAWVNLDNFDADYKEFAQWATGGFSFLLATAITTGTVTFAVGGPGPGIYADRSTNGISSGSWHHIMGTWVAPATVHIYLDGVDETLVTVFHQTVNTILNGAVAATIGCGLEGGGDAFTDGKIAECAVWNRALTQGEVSGLAAGFSPMHYLPGLRFYCPVYGNDTTENELVGGLAMTVTEAVKYEHPRVIMPSRGRTHRFIAPAAGNINTRNRRASAMNPMSPWRGLWPEPDSTIDQADRQQTDFLYAGIAAAEPPAAGDAVRDLISNTGLLAHARAA